MAERTHVCENHLTGASVTFTLDTEAGVVLSVAIEQGKAERPPRVRFLAPDGRVLHEITASQDVSAQRLAYQEVTTTRSGKSDKVTQDFAFSVDFGG